MPSYCQFYFLNETYTCLLFLCEKIYNSCKVAATKLYGSIFVMSKLLFFFPKKWCVIITSLPVMCFSTCFIATLTLTIHIEVKGGQIQKQKGGSPYTNNKVSCCRAFTDMTIISFFVNVGSAGIMRSLLLFKYSAYLYNLSPNSMIKYHLQMCFPHVWGNYGFKDLPRISIFNLWQHEHNMFRVSVFHFFVSVCSLVNLRVWVLTLCLC